MKKTNKKYRKIRNKTRNITRNIARNIARNKTRNKIKYLGKKYKKILIGGTPYETNHANAKQRITSIVGDNHIENVSWGLGKAINGTIIPPELILSAFQALIESAQDADTNETKFEKILFPAVTNILEGAMTSQWKRIPLTQIFKFFGFDYKNPIDSEKRAKILETYRDTELIKTILIDIFILRYDETQFQEHNKVIEQITSSLGVSSSSRASSSNSGASSTDLEASSTDSGASSSDLEASSSSEVGSSSPRPSSASSDYNREFEQNPIVEAFNKCMRSGKSVQDTLRPCIDQSLSQTRQDTFEDPKYIKDYKAIALLRGDVAWLEANKKSLGNPELLFGGKYKKSHKTKVSLSKLYKKIL
jgi:hypothetical protein